MIGMILMAIAIVLGLLKGNKILKEIESDYIDRLNEVEDESTKYKKLVRDLKVELSNCQGTQFYGNTKLALRQVSKVITDFENTNY